ARVRQYGLAILDQGRQLTEMVEHILAFTGGQLARHKYQAEELDVGQLVRQAIDGVAPSAPDPNIVIQKQISEDLTAVLDDSQTLSQALVNLLNNAIRYGGSGGWIGMSTQQTSTDELEIRVADQGPGIPACELKRIFEPFYRGA